MKEMRGSNIDPLKECLRVFDEIGTEPDTEKNTKGLIVFFHGSPCEGFVYPISFNLPSLYQNYCTQ